MFNGKSQNSSFFDHVESEIPQYFAEIENRDSKIFICCKVSKNLPENW